MPEVTLELQNAEWVPVGTTAICDHCGKWVLHHYLYLARATFGKPLCMKHMMAAYDQQLAAHIE